MDTVVSPLRPIRKLLLLVDVGLLLASLVAAVAEQAVLRQVLPLKVLPPVAFQLPEYLILVALALPLWLLLASQLDLYTVLERGWSFPGLVARLIQHHILGFVAVSTLIYATQLVVNRSVVLLFIANSFLTMLALRSALIAWRRFQYRRGMGRTRLLLAGAPSGAMAAFVERVRAASFPPQVVGYLTPPSEPASSDSEGVCDLLCLGTLEHLDQVLHERPVDQVLFFPPIDRAATIEPSLLVCETIGVPALLAIDMGTPTRAKPLLTSVVDHPFVSLELVPRRVELLALKHLFDFVAVACGLILIAPLLLAVALGVLVTMGRPILFGQERAGLRGRPFRMMKFRTMIKNADDLKEALMKHNEMGGPVFKMDDDPRITPFGRFLRKTSIDELPQLFHVLFGTMSLVGPRPLPLAEQQKIRGWHRRRLAMRPGISGLWQVSGRSNLGFDRWMELDLKYVDDWSLWADIKILLKTVPVVLGQKGAK